jgi:hypothetical protein
MSQECAVGAILDGSGFSNVTGGPLDGLYIQGPEGVTNTAVPGYKIWVNYNYEYVWCHVRCIWEFSGPPQAERGFNVLPFVFPINTDADA